MESAALSSESEPIHRHFRRKRFWLDSIQQPARNSNDDLWSSLRAEALISQSFCGTAEAVPFQRLFLKHALVIHSQLLPGGLGRIAFGAAYEFGIATDGK
jgi:hypothetical protein